MIELNTPKSINDTKALIRSVLAKYHLDSHTWEATLRHYIQCNSFLHDLIHVMPANDAVILIVLSNNTYIKDPELSTYRELCKGPTLDAIFEMLVSITRDNLHSHINWALNWYNYGANSNWNDIFQSFIKLDPNMRAKLILLGITKNAFT
jgi:hypothetical protein